jgi:hypothetical protein
MCTHALIISSVKFAMSLPLTILRAQKQDQMASETAALQTCFKEARKQLGFSFRCQNEARSSLKARWSHDIFEQQ